MYDDCDGLSITGPADPVWNKYFDPNPVTRVLCDGQDLTIGTSTGMPPFTGEDWVIYANEFFCSFPPIGLECDYCWRCSFEPTRAAIIFIDPDGNEVCWAKLDDDYELYIKGRCGPGQSWIKVPGTGVPGPSPQVSGLNNGYTIKSIMCQHDYYNFHAPM